MVLLGVVAAFALLVFGLRFSGAYGNWREASRRGGQQYADPFRIAGNLYSVGANDIAAFLLSAAGGNPDCTWR